MKMSKRDQAACLAHLGFVLHQRAQAVATNRLTFKESNKRTYLDTAIDVPASFLRKEIRRFLADQNLISGAEQNSEVERFLELITTEAGLIVARGTDETGDELYGFVHRTFQEYFAAMDVLERYRQDDNSAIVRDFLEQYVHDPHWHEVILLLFGKLLHKFATNQLHFILDHQCRSSKYWDVVQQDLFFVCTCLAQGIRIKGFSPKILF